MRHQNNRSDKSAARAAEALREELLSEPAQTIQIRISGYPNLGFDGRYEPGYKDATNIQVVAPIERVRLDRIATNFPAMGYRFTGGYTVNPGNRPITVLEFRKGVTEDEDVPQIVWDILTKVPFQTVSVDVNRRNGARHDVIHCQAGSSKRPVTNHLIFAGKGRWIYAVVPNEAMAAAAKARPANGIRA
jgi:hypothetical protein